MKSLIKALLVFATLATSHSLHAGYLDDMVDDLGTFNIDNMTSSHKFTEMATATPGSVFGMNRFAADLGGMRVRVANRNFNVFAVVPPRFSHGCSGISMNFGAFSMISTDEIVAMIRQIASNSLSYGLGMAINAMCPKCWSSMSSLAEKVNRFSQNFRNTCTIAQSMVDTARGQIPADVSVCNFYSSVGLGDLGNCDADKNSETDDTRGSTNSGMEDLLTCNSASAAEGGTSKTLSPDGVAKSTCGPGRAIGNYISNAIEVATHKGPVVFPPDGLAAISEILPGATLADQTFMTELVQSLFGSQIRSKTGEITPVIPSLSLQQFFRPTYGVDLSAPAAGISPLINLTRCKGDDFVEGGVLAAAPVANKTYPCTVVVPEPISTTHLNLRKLVGNAMLGDETAVPPTPSILALATTNFTALSSFQTLVINYIPPQIMRAWSDDESTHHVIKPIMNELAELVTLKMELATGELLYDRTTRIIIPSKGILTGDAPPTVQKGLGSVMAELNAIRKSISQVESELYGNPEFNRLITLYSRRADSAALKAAGSSATTKMGE